MKRVSCVPLLDLEPTNEQVCVSTRAARMARKKQVRAFPSFYVHRVGGPSPSDHPRAPSVSELLGPVKGLEALGECDHRAARRLGARLLAAREWDAWLGSGLGLLGFGQGDDFGFGLGFRVRARGGCRRPDGRADPRARRGRTPPSTRPRSRRRGQSPPAAERGGRLGRCLGDA